MIAGNVGVDRAHPVRPGDVMADDHTNREALSEWARQAKAGGAVRSLHNQRNYPKFAKEMTQNHFLLVLHHSRRHLH